jgi:hypothetical protein
MVLLEHPVGLAGLAHPGEKLLDLTERNVGIAEVAEVVLPRDVDESTAGTCPAR